MNPEEEKTIPVQATDADLNQTTPDPSADTAAPASQTADASSASQQAADASYNAGTEQSGAPYGQAQNGQQNPNAQYQNTQGYQQNPNAQYGTDMNTGYNAGMNAGYQAGSNQANVPFNGASYQQNPNAQYGGMSTGYNAGYQAGTNQANAPFNGADYQQNPNAQYGGGMNTGYNTGMNQNNAQYGNAQSFTQGFQNMTGSAGMNNGYNTGANQANAQYSNAQGYQQNPNAQFNGAGYQQNPNAQYGGMNTGYNAGVNQNNAQYNNAQGYQNPYYVNPASVPNAAPAKKKSKKKIWIPIVSVAVVAMIAVGVFLILSSKKTRNPKEVVTSVMANTFPAERTSAAAGWLHSQELDTLATGGSYQMSMNMNIDEVSGSLADEISMLEGFGISTTMALDKDAERFASNAEILYDGTSYLDYDVYAYDDYIALACPSLFDGYIEFKTSNFGVDFNNSPLAQALDTTVDPTIAFEFFELFTAAQTTETEVPRELQEFLDAIRYEEGDKKDLQVNGKKQTCQGYNIIITRESMEHLAKWFCDYANSLGTPIEYDEIASVLPRKDFVMTVYVDNKGRMARFAFDFDLEAAQAELSCQIDFTGLNDTPADHITGNIKMIVEGYAYGFSFESITTTTGSTETQNTTMSVDISGISIANADYTSTFDTQTGAAHMDLSVSAMYTSLLSFNMDYTCTDVVPGESFTLNIDDLTLDVAGELTLGLSGSVSASKLSGPVSEPSGTRYDLFTMTENDVVALGEEIAENAMNGPLGFLFVELYGGYALDDDAWYDDWDDDDWY